MNWLHQVLRALLYATPILLVGALCWAVIGRDLWRNRRRRNRYRSTRVLGRPYRDPRSSLEQFRRIVGHE